ncbi:neuropeptide Y receptor type 4-like [Hydractinia symbiolongicarpus]|uniref:neuropeptide Y receptor type 4-like n=1 Tax=Hydractinia symbiolongicarpus TaxID=13093 RepID=UPI00254B6F22|nr:neuropeptide Y receptor type 4-like [Hydractinia symbiolongicarpus]XP_057308398.1 neuropeptide Y receptor type 4-like [Hydractinia symbiolongicarpus]
MDDPAALQNATSPTLSPSKWFMEFRWKIILIAAYSFVFLCGMVGNTVVLYVIHRKKTRNTMSDVLIASLAFADFLASLNVPLVMIYDLLCPAWHLGYALCKILPSMNGFTICASAWSLVLVSVDRLRIILYPFKAKLSRSNKISSVCFVWFLSLLVTYPYCHFQELRDDICASMWSSQKQQFIYFTIFIIVVSFIPVIVMVIAYTLSAYHLHKRVKIHHNSIATAKRIQQNRRITNMFALIVFVFVVLTTPYWIFVFLYTAIQAFDWTTFQTYNDMLVSLNYSLFTLYAFNSCVNFFIYARMYHSFRKVFKKFLRHIPPNNL